MIRTVLSFVSVASLGEVFDGVFFFLILGQNFILFRVGIGVQAVRW